MMRRMFGAPFGGTTRGGQYDLESKALSLITPPNGSGGGGSCLPSIVTVASGEPGVPLICWACAGKAINIAVANVNSDETCRFISLLFMVVIAGWDIGELVSGLIPFEGTNLHYKRPVAPYSGGRSFVAFKDCFQSSFMLMTVHFFSVASTISASLKVPIFDSGP